MVNKYILVWCPIEKGVIMGVMDINMLKYGLHHLADTHMQMVYSRGFIPFILKTTRFTHSSATLIDHILTNHIAARSSSGKSIKDVADHFAVFPN